MRPKRTACYIIHYGKEWLPWSLLSVAPYVDDIVIAYTDRPSHGHSTNIECPEHESDFLPLAQRFKAYWFSGRYKHEGAHREAAVKKCVDRGADIILVVDADELWSAAHIQSTLSWVSEHIGNGTAVHSYRVAFHHFWRSVRWVCDDPAMPTRVIVPSAHTGEDYIPREFGLVHHFGYAQSEKIIHYKMQIHGHKAEWRPEWWEHKFLGWQPGIGDVHPTNKDFWTPIPHDTKDLVWLIGDHPYFHKDIIR